jgi:hypothetical protein
MVRYPTKMGTSTTHGFSQHDIGMGMAGNMELADTKKMRNFNEF